ncbi:MAG TPA: threonine ammonia-lyase [Polyangiaceae bacterium]|nr:threonine ammonia-lyase [Polyangiaceae bacterium]
MTTELTLERVQAARARLSGRVFPTPCRPSARLSERLGISVYLKLESLQPTGSFKERGACNRLLLLSEAEKARGVVAASAGNHAQAVARHAGLLGIAATVVMPETTPLIKVSSARRLGAEVVLFGTSYDDAYERALELMRERGLTLIHPFDDLEIMAGQGTLALEILEQVPDVEAVVVPVGGGGLVAGVATVVKALAPNVRVYGVESLGFPGMKRAVEQSSPPEILGGKSIADGIAVRRVGKLARAVVKETVDGVVLVDEEEIAEAILLLLEGDKTVAEGAGAVGVAALVHERIPPGARSVVVVVSGGNIDVNLMSRIIERGLVQTGRTARFLVVLPDVAGALAELTQVVAELRANILSIEHDRAFAGVELGQTLVELVLETRGHEHVAEVRARLQARFALHRSVRVPVPM